MESTIITNRYIRVLVATQRAKQLEKGARPRVLSASNKRVRIAQDEVELGLISFEHPTVLEVTPDTHPA